MKKIIIVMVLGLMMEGSASISSLSQGLSDAGGPIPTCYPGSPQCPKGSTLPQSRLFDAGGPIPTCYPGQVCR